MKVLLILISASLCLMSGSALATDATGNIEVTFSAAAIDGITITNSSITITGNNGYFAQYILLGPNNGVYKKTLTWDQAKYPQSDKTLLIMPVTYATAYVNYKDNYSGDVLEVSCYSPLTPSNTTSNIKLTFNDDYTCTVSN